jgi:hypothetical protein
MNKSISVITKRRRGRPVTTGKGTLIGVRLLDGPLATLDAWIARQKEADVSRPEAIRRLVEIGLTVKTKGRPKREDVKRRRDTKQRARELAGAVIDEMTDATASADDQGTRRRRLIRGPEEFQSIRRDRPNRK